MVQMHSILLKSPYCSSKWTKNWNTQWILFSPPNFCVRRLSSLNWSVYVKRKLIPFWQCGIFAEQTGMKPENLLFLASRRMHSTWERCTRRRRTFGGCHSYLIWNRSRCSRQTWTMLWSRLLTQTWFNHMRTWSVTEVTHRGRPQSPLLPLASPLCNHEYIRVVIYW